MRQVRTEAAGEEFAFATGRVFATRMQDRTPRYHLPMTAPEDVIPFLAKGETHWREGYSAHALANTWLPAGGFPERVLRALESHPAFAGAALLDAFLERQTDLRDGLRGLSQTDLLALARTSSGLAVIGVEAKVEEAFGEVCSANASDGWPICWA